MRPCLTGLRPCSTVGNDPSSMPLPDLALAELEREGRAVEAAYVKLLAVLEGTGVMHGDRVPRLGFLAGADFQVDVFEPGFGGDDFLILLIVVVLLALRWIR